MRIGLIARSDRTGLGNQTRNLARLLNPHKIMLIDSKIFNRNEQHPEIYANYRDVTVINGFPSDGQVIEWLKDLDVVLTCEIFYNLNFVDLARRAGVKTVNHFNWEFADYLRQPELTLPDKLVAPSKWMLQEAQQLWGNVEYLPTPVFTDDYQEVKEYNMARNGKKRFLHIMGRQAVHDRNGTEDLIKAMRYSGEDFELVIKAQANMAFNISDPRITIDTTSPKNEVDLYKDFDAMILPRRYGGQCLPMTEALCAGLPVIMTGVMPNSTILPLHWLAPTFAAGRFMTRTWIDLYTVDYQALGQRLDFASKKDLHGDKVMAYNIGYKEFSNYQLKQKWEKLLEDTCCGRHTY